MAKNINMHIASGSLDKYKDRIHKEASAAIRKIQSIGILLLQTL